MSVSVSLLGYCTRGEPLACAAALTSRRPIIHLWSTRKQLGPLFAPTSMWCWGREKARVPNAMV